MTRRTSDIRIKRVYDMPGKADGTRVLVDRLWPRGLSKEKAAVTLWLKEIAPSKELREWATIQRVGLSSAVATATNELARNDASVAQLVNVSKLGPMTLVYAAHDTEHRRRRAGRISERSFGGRSWRPYCIARFANCLAAPIRSCW
jgi:uncharacterized protein YeaO (DUF488 family)